MCTAVNYNTNSHYFGRNLDVTCCYGESVVITPRQFMFSMRNTQSFSSQYAMIGMAKVTDSYPLYFEASNEKGLSIAGLNFPNHAYYNTIQKEKTNLSPFELIPWILGQFESVANLRHALCNLNIVDVAFNENMPLTPLHWMIADENDCIVLESEKDGLKIYENPFGVLTNNPPFHYHMMNMNNYMHLHERTAENHFDANILFDNYSLGLGALGLPGDFSSCSRFVKAAFVKTKSPANLNDNESVDQFFHILGTVAMPKGCVFTQNGEIEYTSYSCCYSNKNKTYYYKTYNSRTITQICMTDEHMNSNELQVFELLR